MATSGLQLGYVWQNDAQNLYPVLGVAGAAHYGAALTAVDANVVAGAAMGSSTQSWALLLKKDGTLQQMDLSTSSATTLTTGVSPDSAITLSPDGKAAALTSASTSAIVLVSGMPAKPQVATLSLPAGSAIAGIAVSDAGTALAGLKQAGSTAVQIGVISETRPFSIISSLQSWGGAAFVPAGATAGDEAAVVADGTSGQVAYVANLTGSSPTLTRLSTAGMLHQAGGVGISPDGKWAFVADRSQQQVLRMSLADRGSAPSAIACACSPQQLVPLTSNGIYSISANASGQPTWILDARTSTPRTFFVPAPAAARTSQTAMASSSTPDGTTR